MLQCGCVLASLAAGHLEHSSLEAAHYPSGLTDSETEMQISDVSHFYPGNRSIPSYENVRGPLLSLNCQYLAELDL